jgi:hypothetical protein
MSAFDVDPATWETLNRLLDAALDLPPAERETGSPPSLRSTTP